MKNRSKALGLWTALGLVVGNMVGAGAYLVPASLGAFGSRGRARIARASRADLAGVETPSGESVNG